MADNPKEFKSNRKIVNPEEAPRVAGRFFFTAVSDEMQLDVGFVDLLALRERVEGRELDKPLDLYITDRFYLSLDAVLSLRETVDGMIAYLKKIGKIKADGTPAN